MMIARHSVCGARRDRRRESERRGILHTLLFTGLREFMSSPGITGHLMMGSLPVSTPPPASKSEKISPVAAANAVKQSSATPPLPSQHALTEMIKDETSAEVALVRRGEEAALARINHLKAASIQHERTNMLLTEQLAAQNEILADITARVAALSRALPGPASKTAPPPWEAVHAAIMTLNQRLSRGTAARQGGTPSSASRRSGTQEKPGNGGRKS